jgi:hypothetical protein
MIDDTVLSFLGALGSGLIAGVIFMVKNVFSRLRDLESRISVTEPQIRQIISDKTDPIKEDVSEIRKSLAHILSLIYNPRKK